MVGKNLMETDFLIEIHVQAIRYDMPHIYINKCRWVQKLTNSVH